jgi:hypothetical protein
MRIGFKTADTQIVITLDGVKYPFNITDAEALYKELHRIFGEKRQAVSEDFLRAMSKNVGD